MEPSWAPWYTLVWERCGTLLWALVCTPPWEHSCKPAWEPALESVLGSVRTSPREPALAVGGESGGTPALVLSCKPALGRSYTPALEPGEAHCGILVLGRSYILVWECSYTLVLEHSDIAAWGPATISR